MNDISVALIGCQDIGRLHLAAWATQSGVRLAAVCDSEELVAARATLHLEGATAFVDPNALLSSDTFDIVDVCLPTAERADVVSAALRAGANVVAEAPLALSSTQIDGLVATARERERLLMPVFPHRFHPPIVFAREMLENDDLGLPTLMRCLFTDRRLLSQIDATGLEDAPIGVMRETGVHGVDLFRALVGDIARVTGQVGINETGPDSCGALVLRSHRGQIGVVEFSERLPGSRNVIEVQGTGGACVIDYDAGTVRFCTASYPVWQTHDVNGLNGLEAALAHFADAVRGLTPLAVRGEDASAALRALEQIGL